MTTDMFSRFDIEK